MPLDPQVVAVLDKIRAAGNPEYWQMTPQQARDWHIRKAGILDIKPVPVGLTSDRSVPGPDGPVPIRIYKPFDAAPGLPVMVWLHGGGHVVGSIETYDAICRMFCVNVGCIVVSVDYRLAPEHKFPAGVEDSFVALAWTVSHATEFGGDPSRIAITGDSAGGNLAAVCAILARDRGLRLVFQLLVYPRTAADEELPSHHLFAEEHLLTRKTILWFHEHYRASDADRNDFRYAPLICPDLSRLPPALIIVGECDPVRDDGIVYAGALERAGNTVKLSQYDGMIHPFFSMGGAIDAGRRAHVEASNALKEAFGLGAGPGFPRPRE
jgi:acetyl esterase